MSSAPSERTEGERDRVLEELMAFDPTQPVLRSLSGELTAGDLQALVAALRSPVASEANTREDADTKRLDALADHATDVRVTLANGNRIRLTGPVGKGVRRDVLRALADDAIEASTPTYAEGRPDAS